ncbi:methanogenesis marker protein Mmp4/MtxX [Methanocalculus sp.]|uniref:methanogenesis marker protein Mmp4/MtxX n=1 Tax=Methanocalculus sp. TaxID=2004547 RepID=UPI0027293324|nr:methanogenesis marker protein Mmp4/MtxX [Methanocalculus sp.]MDO8841319.1 methanogenesis marker protein Mmp4/MtxX [Methanocalculus sp.]
MIIGIGASEEIEKVLVAAEKVSSDTISVIVFLPEGVQTRSDTPLRYHHSQHPERALIDALLRGEIDGGVRGTLPAHSTLRYLREATGVNQIERVALLETIEGRRFLLTPVGVDEGMTINDKVRLIRGAERLADQIGIDRSVGILSGGRLGDIGRSPDVDRTLAEAELLARITGGIHAEILIEEAVHTFGIVIAPDGISGNLIFRTLVLLGSGTGHGAPVVNIGVSFVDTSRASENYGNAIHLAAAIASQK